MTANLQAVKMKNSGIPWIGEVPDYWSVIAVKRVASIFVPQRNKPELNEETGYPWITLDEVGPKFVAQSGKGLLVSKDALSEAGSKVLEAGAVITGCVGTFGTASITQTALVVNQQLQAYIPKKVNAEFLRFCILNSSAYFESVATSTTISYVNGESFADLLIPLPSIEKQKAIAQFLDRKTAAIDALIAKKQRLIELLEEKRSALINQAVTKGLNPDVPIKDSGISWVGAIPEKWKVLQLKRAFVLQRGVDITKEQQTEGEVPVVSSGGISSYHNISIAKAPGVVVGRKGTLGKVYYLDRNYWAHDTTLYVIEFYRNCPRFIFYKLLSMNLESWDTGSANPTLNRNLIHPLKMSFPPRDEQFEIAKFLDSHSENIDRVIDKVKDQINLLQEYRQSVITAVVTGKLDVTQAAVP